MHTAGQLYKGGDMNTGTKIRTFFAALAAIVGAYYTYRGLLDDLLNQLGLGRAAVIVALVAAILLIITEGLAAYFNNDYTPEGQIGTTVTRVLKKDPTQTVNLEMEDGDLDDEDEDPDEDEEGDEVIEENEME